MADPPLTGLEERLSHVPGGKLLVETHTSRQDMSSRLEEAGSGPEGKGLVERWNLFPGVVLTHRLYRADRCRFPHAPPVSVLQISHCRLGQAVWEMRGGDRLSLGPGDLALHMSDACADSVMNFPLGCYEGIAVTVDLETLEREPPEILREAGVGGRQLSQKFCPAGGCAVMTASPRIDHIFSELYVLPPHLRLPYLKVKAQELLLFLSMPEPEQETEPDRCLSQQDRIIQAIHKQLTEHLDRRFTIEELSRQHLINTSSLKAAFKSVYGAPVAAYMKEYRIRTAARLLRETGSSVAEIAAQVGYENQSKFASAFKDFFHQTPTLYRKQHQKVNRPARIFPGDNPKRR